MPEHNIASLGNIHRVANWEYADATERTAATGFIPSDVGKWAKQLDDGSYWELIDDSPATWAQRTGAGAGFTTEQIQDIVGAMFPDAATIDWTYDDATGVVNGVVIGAAPTGSAGGDFTGTYPNPTLADDVVDSAALAPADINAQTGTTYTILASDNNKVITCSNASAITVTVPSGLGAGFSCMVIQIGAGQVTFSPSSTTVSNRQSHTKIAGQYGAVSLVAIAADTFVLGGDTSA